MVSDADPDLRSAVDLRFTEVVENELLVGLEAWEGIPGQPGTWISQRRVAFYDEGGGTRLALREGPHPAGDGGGRPPGVAKHAHQARHHAARAAPPGMMTSKPNPDTRLSWQPRPPAADPSRSRSRSSSGRAPPGLPGFTTAARPSTAARATSGHRLWSPAREARRRRVRRSRCTGPILRPGHPGHIHRAVYIARMTRRRHRRREVTKISPEPDARIDPVLLR